MISNDKKAVIHIAKQQTGMTDPEYRDLLGQVGVTSSIDLTDKTFKTVMSRFEALGFKSTSRTQKRKVDNLPKGKKAQMQMIEAILLDLDLDWAYVDAISKSRFKVDRAQWLEPEDTRKLLQMMIYHQKRQTKKMLNI